MPSYLHWSTCHPFLRLSLYFPLCLFSRQDPEPEQKGHGGSGGLQFVLHAALAICPVCTAHPGERQIEKENKERMFSKEGIRQCNFKRMRRNYKGMEGIINCVRRNGEEEDRRAEEEREMENIQAEKNNLNNTKTC